MVTLSKEEVIDLIVKALTIVHIENVTTTPEILKERLLEE